MIDTSKYEGHTPAIGWRKADGSAMSMQTANNDADAELMADAPLLLAEVLRLRGENERLHEAIRGCDSMKCTWLYEGTYKEMTKHD